MAFELHRPVDVTVRLSSPYGYRRHPLTGKMRLHAGQDYAGQGPILAAADGVVTKVGYAPSKATGYGHYVWITHSSQKHLAGYATLYAHMARATTYKVGDRVKTRDMVGVIGSTGASTGPHLHFELRLNNKPLDPAPFLAVTRNSNLIPNGRLTKETIKEWQSHLRNGNYYRGLIDGIMGPQTIEAIQNWTNHGKTKPGIGYSHEYIQADGIMGPLTRKAVQRKLGVKIDGIWGRETISKLQTYLNGARLG